MSRREQHMGKPELGQRVQLLRRVSRWRAFLPLFTSDGNVEERIGVERTASRHSRYLYSVCAYAREKERKLESRGSMPRTKSQLESHPLSASFIVYYVRYTDNSNFYPQWKLSCYFVSSRFTTLKERFRKSKYHSCFFPMNLNPQKCLTI